MSIEKEIWKDIPGYERIYQASNQGKIRSLTRFDRMGRKWYGKILKQPINLHNYPMIRLCKNGIQKNFETHRLIARTFIGECLNQNEVNHKDGNHFNNHVDNLEYVTPRENSIHALKTGLRKPSCLKQKEAASITGKRTWKLNFETWINQSKIKVSRYDLNNNYIDTFESFSAAARYLNKNSHELIRKCARGIIKTAYGFKWKISDDGNK